MQVPTDKNKFDKYFGRAVLNISNEINLMILTGTEACSVVGMMLFAKRVVFSSANSNAALS